MSIAQLIKTGKQLKELGLTWGTSGNISGRFSEDCMYVSASGAKLSDLDEKDLVVTSINSTSFEGDIKPSKEFPMHQRMYQSSMDINYIIHCSPFYITMVSCLDEEISTNYFVESIHYLRKINWIDYYHPGTEELANAIENASQDSEIVMMKNHGVIVGSKTMEEAVMRLEVLEMTCRMIITAKNANVKLRPIDLSKVREFKDRDIYKSHNS